MSFLLAFFSFFTVLTHRIDWIFDVLTLQLNDNVDDYVDLPQARLYINDRLVNDPKMFYERNGVEWTFVSTVNTNVVRSFSIKYRVHFPTYSITQVKTIVFDVVDSIAPTIHNISNHRIHLNQGLPELKSSIIYSDNYYKIEELRLEIDSTQVILNRIGTYPIEYKVSDPSGNISIRVGYLEVYDHLPPEITIKKEFILSYNTVFVWQNYLTIKDNYDLILTINIDDSLVDYTKLGVYPMSVTATDQSGLSQTIYQDLTIIDDVKPEIILKSQPPPIEVFSRLDENQLKSYIISVKDNYDQLSIDDVVVTHDIEFDVIGEYYIYYSLSDFSNNILETKIKVKVVDTTKPEIWIVQPLVFNVFDPIPFINEYIDYEDNYTNKDDLILKITTSFKMNTIGKYPITVEVTDQSKNKAVYQTYIEIVDLVPPEIIQLNDIIITDFQKKTLVHFFGVTDQYDPQSAIKVFIDDERVDYEKIGNYSLVVEATDSSGNLSQFFTEVWVIDIIEPILTLKQYALIVQVKSIPLNLKSYIDEAYDNYDDLSIDDVIIHHQIQYDKIGVYKVSYILIDQSNNKVEKFLHVSVDDHIAPWISGSQLSVAVHEYFDPLKGIEAGDNLDDYHITYFPKTIDTSVPGDKTITYVITDSRGNYTIFERIITVYPKKAENEISAYIPVVLVTLLGGASCLYIWKKM